ncbi:PREDICTED: putative nuclease HARBI1 [Trachymyrmex cornetzi]|uniref:putative nuclease HARBI1 n=1 Tax=Trachymyrmex cornetzi TaxID=471704 RepID=UPI00084F64C5|nr:PREDICTED: putative nuclease HARBI1 [Trachymyrmex cornetzi]
MRGSRLTDSIGGRSVSDRFGVGKATCFRALRKVISALFEIAHQFIQWPTGQKAVEVMDEFYKISGLRGVIGAIDGTLIEINKPIENGDDYVCRKGKGYPAIHCQAVCTSKLLFTSVLVGHAGSVHNARVLRNSQVNKYMGQPDVYFRDESYIRGDAAYPIYLNLMVPFKNNGHLIQEEINFNYCLSLAHIVIERAFEILKTRWRRIFDRLSLKALEAGTYTAAAVCTARRQEKKDSLDSTTASEDAHYGPGIDDSM